MPKGSTLGKNITYSITGTKLTIEIDFSKEFGESASGKTIIIASTGGNKPVGSTDVILGLNAYRYKEKKVKK